MKPHNIAELKGYVLTLHGALEPTHYGENGEGKLRLLRVKGDGVYLLRVEKPKPNLLDKVANDGATFRVIEDLVMDTSDDWRALRKLRDKEKRWR